MGQVMEDSAPRTPLVFILSPGVDPTSGLLQLAEHTGMAQRFHALSLGQGQAPIAARLLREGVIQGQCPPGSSSPILGPGLPARYLQPQPGCCNCSSCFSRRPRSGRPAPLDPTPQPPHAQAGGKRGKQMRCRGWFPLHPASPCRTLGIPGQLPPVTVVDA